MFEVARDTQAQPVVHKLAHLPDGHADDTEALSDNGVPKQIRRLQMASATVRSDSALDRAIGASLKGGLVVFGLLTCLPGLLAISPALGNQTLFRGQLELTASTDLIVRHWGATIFLVGVAMVVAAFRPDLRGPVLVFALAEKVVLVLLVAAAQSQPWGRAYLMPGILDAVISTWIVLVFLTGHARGVRD